MGDRLTTIDIGRKEGAAVSLSVWGSWVPIEHNVAWAEVYLPTNFHLDPSNRLAIIHQHHRQRDRQDNGPIGGTAQTVLQTVVQKTRTKRIIELK